MQWGSPSHFICTLDVWWSGSMTDMQMYEKLLTKKKPKHNVKVPALLTKLHSAIQSGFLLTYAIVFTRHFFSVTFQHGKSSIIVARQPFFKFCQIHHGTGALYWQLCVHAGRLFFFHVLPILKLPFIQKEVDIIQKMHLNIKSKHIFKIIVYVHTQLTQTLNADFSVEAHILPQRISMSERYK